MKFNELVTAVSFTKEKTPYKGMKHIVATTQGAEGVGILNVKNSFGKPLAAIMGSFRLISYDEAKAWMKNYLSALGLKIEHWDIVPSEKLWYNVIAYVKFDKQ